MTLPIQRSQLPEKKDLPTNDKLSQFGNFKQLTAGAGANLFKVNPDGISIGAANYSSAPFKVSWDGAVIATSGTIGGWTITSSSLASASSGNRIVLNKTDGRIDFYNDDDSLAAKLYNYTVAGGGSDSVGLDANTTAGEVKLTCGGETRLVAKTVSSKAVVEFYGTQKIYSEVGRPLGFATDISPQVTGNNHLGTATYHWGQVRADSYYSSDDSEGITQSESGVTDFDIEIKNGLVTSFTKN